VTYTQKASGMIGLNSYPDNTRQNSRGCGATENGLGRAQLCATGISMAVSLSSFHLQHCRAETTDAAKGLVNLNLISHKSIFAPFPMSHSLPGPDDPMSLLSSVRTNPAHGTAVSFSQK
jgi:hypothetical protein